MTGRGSGLTLRSAGRGLLLAAVLGLAACGSTRAGSGALDTPAAGDATRVTEPMAPSSRVPSAPPSVAFSERANAVAQAARAAGLPTSSGEVFLLSTGTPGLGFDTDAQKVAWGAGQVRIAPGVPTGATGTSTMRFSGGRTVPVTVLDARAALAAQLPPTSADCGDMAPANCQLTITAAKLTTADVETTAGRATVPAWSFRVQGLSSPVVVVAVPAQQLPAEPLEPVTPPGLPAAGPGFTGVESVTAGPGDTLEVTLTYGACDSQVRGHLVEFDDLVVVGGTSTPAPPGTLCNSALYLSTSTVRPGRPLGDRVLVSAADGSVLNLRASR